MPLKTFNDENVCIIHSEDYNNIALLRSEGIQEIISEEDEEGLAQKIIGIINLEESRGYPYVDRVWAEKGWGPLLHLIAMGLYGSIAPTRRVGLLKPAARLVWYKFWDDKRISHEAIEPVFNEPQLDSIYSYADEGFREEILSGIKYCLQNTPEWAEEVIENKLSDEMDNVYSESRIKILEMFIGCFEK